MNEIAGNGYTIRQYTSGKLVLDTPDGDSLVQRENHEALVLDLLSLMTPADIHRVTERAVEMSAPQPNNQPKRRATSGPKGHTQSRPISFA